jgi:hypothetical protein
MAERYTAIRATGVTMTATRRACVYAQAHGATRSREVRHTGDGTIAAAAWPVGAVRFDRCTGNTGRSPP